MIQVDNLQIEEQILPLLDFTHNANARDALKELLTELPDSVDLIQEKQDIFRGFWANWAVVADFSYQKTQLYEVQAFLREVTSKQFSLETNRVRATAQSVFSETLHHQHRARYIQVIQFWDRLQRNYLLHLVPRYFPASFRVHLQVMGQFLERFNLDENARAVQEGTFSVACMVRFARQLQAIDVADLTAFWQAFYRFEAYWSAAKGLRAQEWAFPLVGERGLQLTNFYHPALTQPVANTLTLADEESVVLLTGPNMSGKSTLLKAIGLCVYLGHAGLGVPATQCEMPFFQSIIVAINLTDSLREGYSHFMMELQNLKQVLHTAAEGNRTFAIFDELFRGTNVEDSLELTTATICGLTHFPASYFFVSTHLLGLRAQLPITPAVCAYHIECTIQEGLPHFSYQLLPGWSHLRACLGIAQATK